MGVCESCCNSPNDENNGKSTGITHVKIDGVIKDIENDYLLPENLAIKQPLSDKYTISSGKVGEGASGTVLIGKDKTGKRYAIKSISKKNIFKGQLLVNEARIGLKLNHPNIIKFKEIFEDMKKISFVMELVDGGDLFDFIVNAPNQKLDDFNTIEILVQILDSINYLHNDLHVCHRDLKPENFLVFIDESNKPRIRLIDFGFACYIYEGEKMNDCLGTLSYSAPEIIQKIPYDEKIDMWSIGVLLFNMMTGCEPFTGSEKNKENLKEQILHQTIKFDKLENELLRDLCKKLLEREPEKRIDAKNAYQCSLEIRKQINE